MGHRTKPCASGGSKILTLLIIQKMKKIVLTLTLLLFLHHLLNQLMTDYRVTKIIILLLVIFFLSFLIINHFLNSKKKQIEFLKIFIMIFSIFEFSKFLAFIFGYLPKYNETPFIISSLFSLIFISIYLLILIALCFVFKNNKVLPRWREPACCKQGCVSCQKKVTKVNVL